MAKAEIAITPTRLIEVSFQGDTILAVEHEGRHIVLIEPICDALGVDYDAQLKRMKRTAALCKGAVKMTVPTAGGQQERVGLPKELIHGFVFGIKEGMVNEAARPKLIAYQAECYPALYRHFSGAVLAAPPAETREQRRLLVLQELIEEVAEQKAKIGTLEFQVAAKEQARLQADDARRFAEAENAPLRAKATAFDERSEAIGRDRSFREAATNLIYDLGDLRRACTAKGLDNKDGAGLGWLKEPVYDEVNREWSYLSSKAGIMGGFVRDKDHTIHQPGGHSFIRSYAKLTQRGFDKLYELKAGGDIRLPGTVSKSGNKAPRKQTSLALH
jgi:hypothetical protein